MLHLLLLLLAFRATEEAQAPVPQLEQQFDISFCPMTFYGVTTNKIYVSVFPKRTMHCAFRYYKDLRRTTQQDRCVWILKQTSAQSVKLMAKVTRMPERMKKELQKNAIDPKTLICMFKITYDTGFDFYYANLGNQSFMYTEGDYSGVHMRAFYYGSDVQQIKLPPRGKNPMHALFFLNGCQYATKDGVDFIPIDFKKNCQRFSGCYGNGSVVIEYNCKANQECDGQGSCVKIQKMACSLFANSVINSKEHHRSIKDRCTYILVSNLPSLYVLGTYGYRRRTNVAFLDSIYFQVQNTVVELLGGSEVTVNGTTVQVTQTEQDFGPVTVSKDSMRVSAVAGDLTIAFDGTSCLISALNMRPFEGLCVDAGYVGEPLSRFRNMDLSPPGCQRKYPVKPDPTIDCREHRTDCERLFANETGRTQFKRFCRELLCAYDDLDRLSCHIENSYAQRTDKKHPTPSCAEPSPCLNHKCSPHEFCGETVNQEPICVCREDFMEPYRANQRYVGMTECDLHTASVDLPICVLEDKGYNASKLRMLDSQCTGEINKTNRMIKFWFSHEKTCGAKITSNASSILYENVIMAHDLENAVITHKDLVFMNFSCSYRKQESSTMTILILDKSVVHNFDMGEFDYNVTQKLCLDRSCRNRVIPGQVLALGTRVYVHLKVNIPDPRITLRIKTCWGEPDTGGLRHYIINDWCADPRNRRVTMTDNGEGDHCSFNFLPFRFIGYSGTVHMNCEVELCLKDVNDDNSCKPDCAKKGGGRAASTLSPKMIRLSQRRRSVDSERLGEFTALSWITQEGLFH